MAGGKKKEKHKFKMYAFGFCGEALHVYRFGLIWQVDDGKNNI